MYYFCGTLCDKRPKNFGLSTVFCIVWSIQASPIPAPSRAQKNNNAHKQISYNSFLSFVSLWAYVYVHIAHRKVRKRPVIIYIKKAQEKEIHKDPASIGQRHHTILVHPPPCKPRKKKEKKKEVSSIRKEGDKACKKNLKWMQRSRWSENRRGVIQCCRLGEL